MALVSIAVPTYNRRSSLEQALLTLRNQDHADIEITICDNASNDNTREFCHQVSRGDPRIRYFRNEETIPAIRNFRKGLLLATGRYFMWAADDDLWAPTFISTLLPYLEADSSIALVAPEAHYRLEDGTILPFFPEGRPWYDGAGKSRRTRVAHVIRFNYGNLIYGLYRREALTDGHSTVLDQISSPNEIPVFLQVAATGNIMVRPQVLFYKTAPLAVGLQAAREQGALAAVRNDMAGRGTRPSGVRRVDPRGWVRHFRLNLHYHWEAWTDSRRALAELSLLKIDYVYLAALLTYILSKHFIKVAMVWPLQDLLSSLSVDRPGMTS